MDSIKPVALLLLLVACCGFTKTGTLYTTDGTEADVNAAYADVNFHANDAVYMPTGTNKFGTGGIIVSITKPSTLYGAGTNTLILVDSASPQFGGPIAINSDFVTVSNFSITVTNGNSGLGAFHVGTNNWWRFTGITVNGANASSYMWFVEGGYGLIDHCILNGNNGACESIFVRGPTNSWNTATTIGTTNCVCIENCVFAGNQYCEEGDADSRITFRYNLILGPDQVDMHMIETSQGTDSVHHGGYFFDCYGNVWVSDSLNWDMADITTGSGRFWNNVCTNSPWMCFYEYGAQSGPSPYWTNKLADVNRGFMTPNQYPAPDQIGTGTYPQSSGQSPYYIWNNVQNLSGNGRGSVNGDLNITWKAVNAGAIAQYTNEQHNATATFSMTDIIGESRDYFKGTNGGSFTGTGGVGVGTLAQMNAITPTKTGVGFWATNVDSWNTTLPANTSGRFSIWNGSAWVAQPMLTYPHPAISSGGSTPPSGGGSTANGFWPAFGF